MWHVSAFYESRTGTTTFTTVNALSEEVLTTSGADLTISPTYTDIIAAFATLSNVTDVITGAQLSAPSLRATSLLDLPILRVIAAGSTYTPGFPFQANMFLNGLQKPRKLVGGEKLNLLVESSAATAADLISGVVMMGDGNYANPYAGLPVETIEFTTSTAAVANTWTAQSITASQTLHAGKYAIVGMESYLTTGKAARIVPNLGDVGRPGCFPTDRAVAGHGLPHFRLGNMGIYTHFTNENLPRIEVFSTAADTAATTHHYMDILKVG